MIALLSVIATAMIGPLATPAVEGPERCSVSSLRDNPDGYHWPVERVEAFVASAEHIVQVTALWETPDSLAVRDTVIEWPRTTFRIDEQMKGELDGSTLQLRGRVVEEDDFNPNPVPYQIVRPSGQRGMCYTDEYREGGRYLLMLVRGDGELTHRIAPLAPTNEQIRGPGDPWVEWVREQISEGGRG